MVNLSMAQGLYGWTCSNSSDTSNWYGETGTNGPNGGTSTYNVKRVSTYISQLNNTFMPCHPGQVIKASGQVRGVGSPNAIAGIYIAFYDINKAFISSPNSNYVTGNVKQTLYLSATAPANAAFVTIGPTVGSATTPAGYYTWANFWWNGQPASMDEVPDGSTYGRPLGSRLSSGKPWIDFAEGIHANKNFDNIADGASRYAAVFAAAEQQAIHTPGANLIPNSIPSMGSSFYSLGSGWSVGSNFGGPVFNIVVPGTSTTSSSTTGQFACPASSVVSASVDVICSATFTSGDFSAWVEFLNSSGSIISSSGRIFTLSSPTANAFQRVALNGISTPAGTVKAQIRFLIETAAGSGSCQVRRFKVEVGATASPFNDDTTQFGNLLTAAGSGQQIGDQRNLKQRTVTNIPAKVPTTISYSAAAGTPATATISVGAFMVLNGSVSTAYNASSVSVTGTNGTNVTYYLYMNDAYFAGGTQTLIATTNSNDVYSGDGYIYVGGVTVSYPSSGSGSGSGGGGGSSCPLRTAWVIRRGCLGRPQHIRASQVRVGDCLLLINGSWGDVTYSSPALKPCVRVIVRGGTLGCSDVAPLKTKGGRVLARDAKGVEVLVRGDDIRHVDVIDVLDIGEQWVQHITIHDEPNDFFWTGDSKSFLFAHHNIKPP